MAHVRRIAFVFLFIASFSCAAKRPANSVDNSLPPNMHVFYGQLDKVWGTLTTTIQFDYLIPIQILEEEKGYFSSELVRESQPLATKYRVSGTVVFDGAGVVVTLYKHQQILENENWKTIPSDLVLEKKILDAVVQKLSKK